MNYSDTFWKVFEHKILVDYERAKQFVHDKQMPAPRFSNMYITSSCNQNCQYCEYSQENQRRIITPTERVIKSIEELRELGVRSIDFCGGGEPTLHPALARILHRCRALDIVVGLFTNLAVKNDKLLEAIILCCSYVRISIDTYNNEQYNLIRRPRAVASNLATVVRNIDKLVQYKRKYKANIILGSKALITKFNSNEIEDFIKKSIDHGLDAVQYKKASLYDNLCVPQNEMAMVEKRMQELKQKYSKHIDILFNIENLVLHRQCFMHINHIFIDAFGDVYLCCYYLRRKAGHRIGNIYKNTIRDIWHGKRHREVARSTRIEECNQMDCRWIKYNNMMRPLVYEDKLRQLDFV